MNRNKAKKSVMSNIKILIIRGSSGEGDNDLGFHLMNGFKAIFNGPINMIEYENTVRDHPKWQAMLDKGIRSIFNKELKLISITEKANASICDIVSREHFDLILVAKGMYLDRCTLKRVKLITPSSLIYNYYADNILLNYTVMNTLDLYDRVFLIDEYVKNTLDALCLKTRFDLLYPSADPQKLAKPKLTKGIDRFEYDLSLIGSLYPYRSYMLEGLQEFDFRIWGGEWGYFDSSKVTDKWKPFHTKQHAYTQKRADVFYRSKININTRQPVELISGCNTRMQHILAHKGFQIVQYSADLEKLYSIDKEMVTFKTRKELLEKVRFYIQYDDLRDEIVENGYKRLIKQHTTIARCKKILEYYDIDRTNTN